LKTIEHFKVLRFVFVHRYLKRYWSTNKQKSFLSS